MGVGNGPPLFQQVLAHGFLELSCIAVAGAAGLRMGWAIIDPGSRPRGVALREEARAAAEMLLGTAAWLVVAGLVEGFVTPSGQSLTTVLVVGLGLGIVFWGSVFWLGRPARAGGRQRRARAFRRRYAPTHASPNCAGDASRTTAPVRRSRAATRVRASSTSRAIAVP